MSMKILVCGMRCKRECKLSSAVAIGFVFTFLVCKISAGVIDESYIGRIVNYRNTSINPCENFYAFACGNYAKANVTPIHELQKSILDHDITNLISYGPSPKDFKPFKLIDDLYKTCMNDNAVGQEALALLDRILKKLGNWPVFENDEWKESNFDWIDFTIGSKKLGLDINYFLDLRPWRVMENNKIVVRYMIDIAPAEFKDPISNSSDPLVTAYAKYIQSVFKLLKNKDNSSKEINEIIEFERQVSKINVYNTRTLYREKLTLEELMKKWPTINWNELINNIIIRNLKTSVEINEISLWTSQAVSDFIELVQKTPKHVQANYAVWKIIQKTIPYLTEKYRVLQREYCLTQKCENTTRAHSCVSVVKRHLSPAVNLLYAKNFYNSEIEAFVTDMILKMKDQLISLINESWMDQQTKDNNVQKIRNQQFVIGFREKNQSDDAFVKLYDNLEIDTSNYLQTLLDLELFAIENRFNETNFDLESRTLFDSFYPIRLYKTIYLPWTNVRQPFFDVNYPMYVNYGYIGSHIAYELIKSIDDLDDTNKEANNERTTCFRNQLSVIRKNFDGKTNKSSIIVPLNGQITAQMGIKISYLTYRRAAQNTTEQVPLELTAYTDHQLFWINLGENLCTKDFSIERIVVDDKYTAFEFFYSKILSSVTEFYDDFNCYNKSFIKNYGTSCTYL